MIKLKGYSTIETILIIPLFVVFISIILYLYRMNVVYLDFNNAIKETNELIFQNITDPALINTEWCETLLKDYFLQLNLDQSKLVYTCTIDIDTILIEAEYTMSPTGSIVFSNTFKAHNLITGLELFK